VNTRIGFMQGRLSPLVDGRIQSFPWSTWRREFADASRLGFSLIEWTLDQENLYQNPLLMAEGRAEILSLCARYRVAIPSLTGDCFMQQPFWRASPEKRQGLMRDFISIASACQEIGAKLLVVPLVDNGSIENEDQEDVLVEFLTEQSDFLESAGLRIVFESDFPPEALAAMMGRLSPSLFGVNYDIGNSAALGYRPRQEFAAYGSRIFNVHVKDRMIGGTTVSLGTGSANFEEVFSELARLNYKGNFILQTARAEDDDHAGPLVRYRDMTERWIAQSGLRPN